MPYNLTTPAMIFSIKPLGENNADVCLFTQSEGIIHSVMYGGRKSRLKALVSPWNTGTAYLSKTKSSVSFKISDFDVQKYHLSFRENILKNYASAFAAELTIKTNCAGNSKRCWTLVNGFIDGLELCSSDSECRAGLIRFLWRFLQLLGVQPSAETCSECGKTFLSCSNGDSRYEANLSGGAVYNPVENAFICGSCSNQNSFFGLSAESMRYLAAVSIITPGESRKLPLSSEADAELRRFLYLLIETFCDSHFNSLKTGAGIL
ncbi:MAG: DNA repair protein RecO [Treponema sp.]